MRAFAELLDHLTFTPQHNAKLRLIEAYLASTPDPDRGWALAALTSGLEFPNAKRAMVRDLALERIDPVLFELSRDYVGDTVETVALIWPGAHNEHVAPALGEVVCALKSAGRSEVRPLVASWLDGLGPSARFACLKLITGGLRIGVSARLAKQAVANFAAVDVQRVEEIWHGLEPPYLSLFAWAEGSGPEPEVSHSLRFHPLMLANALDEKELAGFEPDDFMAEWKWDGIRVQISASGASQRIFSRGGDDITAAFPDIAGQSDFNAVLDGELLIMHDGVVAPFNDLQQRIGRKKVSAKSLHQYPAHVRLYDALFINGDDVRNLPLIDRRAALEAWFACAQPQAMDLSPLIAFDNFDELAALRANARQAGIEGLMLKRCDSHYLAGRPKGPWFKWKHDPLTADAVLMYAQHGSGKRSSLYSDYTFGAWREGAAGDELVPVGKAYSGFTDEELAELDRFVRANTVNSFGPVKEVVPQLVFEVAFDSIHRSSRHKSGITMRFPRIARIRWDKPAHEADRLEALEALIDG
ncbi:MAG: cisplatin damage response ATP-dependent DNA ligase [Rhizobiales bacterium]|nr:cisplatin damage response ATP-dependent DNA ligase [Hyphomicrobiales bacterium]